MESGHDGLYEEPVSSREIFRGRIVHLFEDTVRLPNGKLATREVMRHPGAVAIVPLTGDGEVILVRQYRYPFAEALLEIPAGKLDPGEEAESCARRELEEETGVEAAELIPLGVFYPSVAVLDEKIFLFLARGLTQKNSHPDEDEFLRVERASDGNAGSAYFRRLGSGRKDADGGAEGLASAERGRQRR